MEEQSRENSGVMESELLTRTGFEKVSLLDFLFFSLLPRRDLEVFPELAMEDLSSRIPCASLFIIHNLFLAHILLRSLCNVIWYYCTLN